jgi:co-chaperonin GroES (HSP10)
MARASRLVGFDRGLIVPTDVAERVAGTSYGAAPVSAPEYNPFPDVDPQCRPAGFRILVQIRAPKTHSKGGLMLAPDVTEAEKWHQSIAKVLAVGPRSYKDRETDKEWAEGPWCKPGDIVRIPKHGNDRFRIDGILFAIINDDDVLGVVTGDVNKFAGYLEE